MSAEGQSFDAMKWLHKSIRGGVEWALLADGCFKATKIPSRTWKRLGPQFYPHEQEIVAAMRTLVGPGHWYLRPSGNVPMPPHHAEAMSYMQGAWQTDRRTQAAAAMV